MKHRVGFNRLGRKPAHRKALHRNMVTSLFRHERIQTTKAKALAVRRTAEKMITRAKIDSVHNRRMVGRDIKDKSILAKLFTEIGPRFKERPGGYTRVLKLGYRKGDASKMVLLELVEREGQGQSDERKSRRSRKSERQPVARETTDAVTIDKTKADEAVSTEDESGDTAGDENSSGEETRDVSDEDSDTSSDEEADETE